MMSSCKILLLITIWGFLFNSRCCPPGAPQVNKSVVSPGTIKRGVTTDLTVTSKIILPPDSKLITTDVKLLRAGACSGVDSLLGSMQDEGANGDAVAGDGVFTLKSRITALCSGKMGV